MSLTSVNETDSRESKSEHLTARNLEEPAKEHKHILIVVTNTETNDVEYQNKIKERQFRQKEEVSKWDAWVKEHYSRLVKVL